MTTTIIGEAGVYSLESALDPQATLPVNGEQVSAPIFHTAEKRKLDYIAQIALEVLDLRDNIIPDGVPAVSHVSTIAQLRSAAGMADGDVRLVRDPVVTSDVVSSVGLFVYDSASTVSETVIPGAVDGYVVVLPNSGVGRWFNVTAGIGWSTGANARLMPRGQKRSGVEITNGPSGTDTTIADSGGYFDTGIGMGLSESLWRSSTTILVAANFSFKSGSLGSGFEFQLERSIDGGAWTQMTGSRRRIGGVADANNFETAVHIQAAMTMGSSVEHAFRVTVDTGDSDEITIYRDWQMTATWHWDGV